MTAKNFYNVDAANVDEMQTAISSMANETDAEMGRSRITKKLMRQWDAADTQKNRSDAFTAIRAKYYRSHALDYSYANESEVDKQMELLSLPTPVDTANYLVHKAAGISVELCNGYFEVTE